MSQECGEKFHENLLHNLFLERDSLTPVTKKQKRKYKKKLRHRSNHTFPNEFLVNVVVDETSFLKIKVEEVIEHKI